MAARLTRWLETGAAATRPSLLGRVVGVPERDGSFGRFVVSRRMVAPAHAAPSPDIDARSQGDARSLPKLSAGLLLFRRLDDDVELLIAHPGGPIWEHRDHGAWGLPKGAANDGEELLDAARREFEEELGHPPPHGPEIYLGEIRLRSRKIVHGWAVEGDFDPEELYSMQAELVWPPRSGKVLRVPEIDRVIWARPAEARQRMHPAQAAFVDRLLERLPGLDDPDTAVS